jgi:hypothetical protein
MLIFLFHVICIFRLHLINASCILVNEKVLWQIVPIEMSTITLIFLFHDIYTYRLHLIYVSCIMINEKVL